MSPPTQGMDRDIINFTAPLPFCQEPSTLWLTEEGHVMVLHTRTVEGARVNSIFWLACWWMASSCTDWIRGSPCSERLCGRDIIARAYSKHRFLPECPGGYVPRLPWRRNLSKGRHCPVRRYIMVIDLVGWYVLIRSLDSFILRSICLCGCFDWWVKLVSARHSRTNQARLALRCYCA